MSAISADGGFGPGAWGGRDPRAALREAFGGRRGRRGHRHHDDPRGHDHHETHDRMHQRGFGGPGPGFGRHGHFGPGGGFGPGGFGGFGPGFGGDFGFGRGPRGRGRGRRSRGDVRAAVLALLLEQPMHGYQIIQEITERSGGAWKPSPGSVYPALQLLEDEGLVRTENADGRRVVQLTDAGKEYAEARREELAATFDALTDGPGDDVLEIRNLVGQVMMAFGQVMQAGTPAQVSEAKKVLTQARKALYVILAQDDEDNTADEPTN